MGNADIISPFGNHSNYQGWDDSLVHLCINFYDPRIDTPIISITIPKLTFSEFSKNIRPSLIGYF